MIYTYYNYNYNYNNIQMITIVINVIYMTIIIVGFLFVSIVEKKQQGENETQNSKVLTLISDELLGQIEFCIARTLRDDMMRLLQY